MQHLPFYLLLLFFTQASLAMPSLSNRCGQRGKSFSPPENTTIVAFDENCDTAFVGPPLNGKLKLDRIMGSTNLLFCETVKTLPKTVEATRKGMQFWVDRIAAKSRDYDETVAVVSKHTEKLNDLRPLLEQKSRVHEKHQEEVNDARKVVTEIRRRYDDCKLTGDAIKCEPINGELKEAARTLSHLRSIQNDAEQEVYDLEYQIKKETSRLEEVSERMDRLMADLGKFKRLLRDLETDALEGYERYGRLHGATATVNFHANWSKLIQEAQQNNRRFHIEQLPLIGTKVDVSVAMPEGFGIKSMSSLLGARVPGFNTFTDEKDTTQKIDLGREMSLNPVPWATTMTGQLDFNLIGACTLTDERGNLEINKAQRAIGSTLSINTQHTYPILLKRDYDITFNAKKIVSEMETYTESGGFLSSSKIHDLVKYNFTSEKFSVQFHEEGGRSEFTAEEKEEIRTDAKYEIVDRILRGINAIPQYGNERPPLPQLDHVSGARFIYKNIPCFGYPVCYVTGFVIGVVDAIFGSKESISTFKEINQADVTHRYSEISPSYKTLTTTFSGTGE